MQSLKIFCLGESLFILEGESGHVSVTAAASTINPEVGDIGTQAIESSGNNMGVNADEFFRVNGILLSGTISSLQSSSERDRYELNIQEQFKTKHSRVSH